MSSVTQQVQKQFGPAAQAYATFSFHANGPDLPLIVEAAGLTGSEIVVDLGSGAGHTALACGPHAAKVVGVDVTPQMVETATALALQRGLANVEFRAGDVAHLPFADGSVDVVTSRVSAHHFADVPRVLAEAWRVLKPEGRLIVSDTVAPEDAAADTFLNCIEVLRDPSHVRDYRGSEWMRMLQAAGFAAEMLARMPLALDGADWVKRQDTSPARVAAIRELLRDAHAQLRSAFEARDDPWGFTMPIGVMRATRA